MVGRKPIDIQQLDQLDRRWFMAFHGLREGIPLPIRPLNQWFRYSDSRLASARLRQLEQMAAPEFWTDFLSQEPQRPRPASWEPPAFSENRRQIEQLHHDELEWLKQRFDPERVRARSEGMKVWSALWPARSLPPHAAACRRWLDLHRNDFDYDVGLNPTPLPIFLLDHAKPFLQMKRDRRFPRSEHANDARLDYLSRGTAGIELGISPLTAIDRLRKLKHGLGGPLWHVKEQRCLCWRCLLLKDQGAFYLALGQVG